MIRPLTIVGLGLVAILTAALFQLKYEVRGLESEFTRIEAALGDEEEAIRVLGAEWSFLNRPSRLQALSDRYLVLSPLAQPQLRSLTDVPLRAAESVEDEGESIASAAAAPPLPAEELVRMPAHKPFRLPTVRGR